MRIVTVCTHSERYFPCLVESLKKFHHDLQILEWGKKWTGLPQKLSAMLDYTKSIDPMEIVCLVDAYDVIFLRNPHELEQRFLASGSKMMIARDAEIDSISSWFRDDIYARVQGEMINSGTYIAFAGHLFRLLTELMATGYETNDDQQMLAHFLSQNEEWVDIDRDSKLFLTLDVGPKNRQLSEQDVTKIQQSTACVLHAPMEGNINLLLTHLGYKIPAGMEHFAKHRFPIVCRVLKQNLGFLWPKLSLIGLFVVLLIAIICALKK